VVLHPSSAKERTMKRVLKIGLWLALLLAVGCTEPHKIGPYLQTVSQDSATIAWETTDALDSRVEYGLTSGYGQSVSSADPVNLHEVTLTGLSPETLYHYRVISGSATGLDHTFRTAVYETTPFKFAMLSDTQSDPFVHGAVANAILKENPALVLHAGDEVGEGTDYDSWRTEFFNPARNLMSQVPVYVAIGNHEGDSPWFYYYHAYPEPEDCYAFRYGNSFFVMIDTNKDFSPGSPLYAWIVETLSSPEAQSAQWRFVTHHHPAYSEGWNPCDYDGDLEVREILVPLMETYGVDAVFNGHTHGYERGLLNGVAYVIAGGGGGTLDHFCQHWPHVVISRYIHHYVTVDIDGAAMTLKAHQLDGSVFDSYSVQK
jgi:acid phosphatase type 7